MTKFILWRLGARRCSLVCGDVRLAYYRLGPQDGEPWLMIHGLGSTAASWAPLLKQLARRPHAGRLYLIPEMSALGGTEAPDGAISLDLAPEVLRCLLDREAGQRPITLVGISLGSWMAMRLLLDRPDPSDSQPEDTPISHLVLIAPAGFAEQDWQRILSMVRIPSSGDGAPVDQIARLLDAFYIEPPWPLRRSKRTLVRIFRSPVVAGLLDTIEPGDAYSRADLASIDIPSAVIWGEHDGLLSPASAATIADEIASSYRYPLADSAHALGWENPAGLAEALEAFVQATSSET